MTRLVRYHPRVQDIARRHEVPSTTTTTVLSLIVFLCMFQPSVALTCIDARYAQNKGM